MLSIYLTDLAAYNKGYLFGEWIQLPMEQDELEKKLERILSSGAALCFTECGYYEKHEEYFSTDSEWDEVEVFKVDEYINLHALNENVHLLSNIQEHTLKAVKFLLDEGIALDLEDAIEKADDVIIHENQTMEDIAYNLIHECYSMHELPPFIANHIDYDGIARDLELDGNYTEIDGDIFEYIA